MLARLCPRLLQPPHSPLQLPGSPHSKSAAAMRHLHAYQPPHQPPRPQPPRPQHSQRCRAACSSSGSQPTSSSAASYLVSPLNQHVQPAQPGEVAPLRLGPRLLLDVPLLAAPMAGLSCAPLRLMHTQAGARLAVSEMVIASTLQQGNAASRRLARFHPAEAVRSVQLYGVRPEALDWACRYLVNEAGVHHIDLNFGCPVRKVTSRGGGAALPLRPRLLRRLVAAATRAAGPDVPVTVKLRMGLTPQLLTAATAAQAAADEGAAAVTLHARTADQLYAPPAHWQAVQALVQQLSAPGLPVIGNGDVFEAADAVALMRATGCAGVMIGRAALGRPWLFAEAADMLQGRVPQPPPALAGVLQAALHHVQAWADWEQHEQLAVLKMRKLIPTYLHGFASARRLQGALFAACSLADWQAAISDVDRWSHDPGEPFPAAALRHPRLKGSGKPAGTSQRVVLPHGWLEGADDDVPEELLAGMDEAACEG